MDKLFGQFHHIIIIAVSFVKFQHGELWIMLGRDSFIPEVSINLVDFFKASHDQPLQIKLWSYSQIKVNTQGIVKRFKRPS